MKLTKVEKFLVRSPLRAYDLRKIEAPRVLSNLGIGERSICLEIGCGSGIGALLINQYLNCEQIVGIDIDPDMVTAAKKCISHLPKWAQNIRTDNIEFLCEDATKFTFPDRYFDAVFLFGVLHHIKEWKKVISEAYRVLKVGGVFSFEEILLPNYFLHFDKLYSYLLDKQPLGYIPISEEELKDDLDKRGFSIQSFKRKRILSTCFVRARKKSV